MAELRQTKIMPVSLMVNNFFCKTKMTGVKKV